MVEAPEAMTEHDLGYGISLMTLGLFACINLLAKIYVILAGKTAPITKAQRNKIQRARRKYLLKFPNDKHVIESWKIPRVGEVNETDAVVIMLQSLPEDINFGIGKSRQQIVKFWDDYRNKLSHTLSVGMSIHGFGFRVGDRYQELLRERYADKSNTFFEGGLVLSSLIRDVGLVEGWILEQIRNNRFSKTRIRLVAKWLKT